MHVHSTQWLNHGKHLISGNHLKWRRQWQATPVLLPRKSHGWRSLVGYSPWGRYESVATERLHFHFHAMEKEMATHSSVLAWRIPGTEEPGGLLSMGSHRVGHDWSDLAAAATIWRLICHRLLCFFVHGQLEAHRKSWFGFHPVRRLLRGQTLTNLSSWSN